MRVVDCGKETGSDHPDSSHKEKLEKNAAAPRNTRKSWSLAHV